MRCCGRGERGFGRNLEKKMFVVKKEIDLFLQK
jgi:hypothetical protein